MGEESLRRNHEEEDSWMRNPGSGKHLGAPWNLLEVVLGLAGGHLGGIWELLRSSKKQFWGSEAPDASDREKVAYLSAQMQKFL